VEVEDLVEVAEEEEEELSVTLRLQAKSWELEGRVVDIGATKQSRRGVKFI
jgi:hypothetical protein